MRQEWYVLAKSRMKALKITQDEISERLGVTPGAVGHWLNGRRNPNLAEISTLMGMLGFDKFTINSDGTIQNPDAANLPPLPPPKPQYVYPLLSAAQIASRLTEGKAGNEKLRDVPTEQKASSDAFWMEVRDNSMTAQPGNRPSFPSGMIILVDPKITPTPREFCVAMFNGDVTDLSFKRLIRVAGDLYLESLNDSFRPAKIDDIACKIIGKVTAAKWESLDF